MTNTATYQGTTREELQRRILNIENTLLNNEMEVWEAKEFNEVMNEYKQQIEEININQQILDTL